MNDNHLILSGIILILFIVFAYGASLLAFLKKKYHHALFCILTTGLVVRIFSSLDPMVHTWDERYHALVAKNMIDRPLEPRLYKESVIPLNYQNWTFNEIWLHKQPVPLWTMAISMKVFGINEFTLRLPSIILSTLSIFLTFLIGLFLFNSKKIGLIAAFFQSINGLAIELAAGRCATDHIDTFFLFFIQLSIVFILLDKKYNHKKFLIFAGVACGLAILSKWLPALIVMPLYFILNFEKKSNKDIFYDLVILFSTVAIVVIPWQLYAYMKYPMEYSWEMQFNRLHFTQALEGNGQPWWYFLNRIRININELVYVVFLWYAYSIYKNKTYKNENLFLLIYIVVPFLVFSLAKTKMQGYLLFTYPAYFIIMALFIEDILYSQKPSLQIWSYRKFNYLLTVSIAVLAIRYGIERIKPFQSHEVEGRMKKELTALKFPPNSVVFNISCPIEMMFYTECIALPFVPEKRLIDHLYSKKYNLYILDNTTLSEEVKQEEKIKKIDMPATIDYTKKKLLL